MLKAGEIVRIFVFNPISHLRYGDFDINLAAGLEEFLDHGIQAAVEW